MVEFRRPCAGEPYPAGAGSQSQFAKDVFHLMGDLYVACANGSNSTLIKPQFFIDYQDDYRKCGPALGLLFNAQSAHPVSVDIAYGFGYGYGTAETPEPPPYMPPPMMPRPGCVNAVGDDLQVRIGTFVSDDVQVGLTFDCAHWDHSEIDDDYFGGGFFAILQLLDNLVLTGDLCGGDAGMRGFLNLGWEFESGPPASTTIIQRWLTRSVIRNVNLRLRRHNVPPA